MKRLPPLVASVLAVALSLPPLCALAADSSRNTASKPAQKANAKTDAASPAEPEIPESVFVAPNNPKEGKDPFFPGSTYPYAQPVARPQRTNSAPATLTLTGFSKKLVMVNGRPLAEGEEADVPTNAGRKHIRCVKIKEDSAIIEVLPEGERQELKAKGL